MTNQIFKIPEQNKKQQQARLTQQQQEKANQAKRIAYGTFALIAIPMIAKIYLKGPYTSLIIGAYWVIVIIITMFLLSHYVYNKFIKTKPKEKQKELDLWKK